MAAINPTAIAATVPDLWRKAVEALKEKDKQNVDFQRSDKLAILVDVLEEVQRKKKTCINRRLKYKRSNGDSVHLYDVCEKIVKWVNKFKEVGDVAKQYDPGYAALPWAVVRYLLQVCCWGETSFGLESGDAEPTHRSLLLMSRSSAVWLKDWKSSARPLLVMPQSKSFIFESHHRSIVR